jgi:hypothetical protein
MIQVTVWTWRWERANSVRGKKSFGTAGIWLRTYTWRQHLNHTFVLDSGSAHSFASPLQLRRVLSLNKSAESRFIAKREGDNLGQCNLLRPIESLHANVDFFLRKAKP